MTSKKFEDSYAQLNARQKLAVDTIEGPVMVVAGPGTGKTKILTLRIANILKQTQAEPESILALTFTEAGVATMRRRLAEIIGGPAYSVTINTFHGFCNDIIKNYPGEFPRIIGSQNITEVDQIELLKSAIRELPLKRLRPFGNTFHYVGDVLWGINQLKREGVDPAAFVTIVRNEERFFEDIPDKVHLKGPHVGKMKGEYQKLQEQIEKNAELALVYTRYKEDLEKNHFYDYNDMIMEVLRELGTNENLRLQLQEQYQYVLVDEHQDTNNAQNKILELLMSFHPQPNLFVVGDEKQAIFRFQGASLENFLHFQKLYPDATLVVLEENYRSTQAILDSAHSLIQNSALTNSAPLTAKSGHAETHIGLYVCTRPEVEAYFVARSIEEHLARGVHPEEIAVLYRDNQDVGLFARMLEKVGVPFSIESNENILRDNNIRKVVLLLRAVAEFGVPEHFIEALHIDFLCVEPLDVYKLSAYANTERRSVYDIAKTEAGLRAAGIEAPEAIYFVYRKLAEWASLSKNYALSEFFETLIRESGFLGYILARPDAVEQMEKINGLFDEVKSLMEKHKEYTLKDFLVYLDTLEEHALQIRRSEGGGIATRVRLMTAHKSKGQEFEYVYIVNAYNGHWGNKKKFGSLRLPDRVFLESAQGFEDKDNIEDERRLFYVALTRAKKEVIISYSTHSSTKKELLPSQFIAEIRPELIEVQSAQPYEEGFDAHKEIVFAAPVVSTARIQDKEFVKELFLKRGLSATALNNYLTCPWRYFYQNLFRIPGAMTKHQMYGTAVHATLKDFFDNLSMHPWTKEELVKKFEFYLRREPLSVEDFEESLEKGRRALSGYAEWYHGKWRPSVITEKDIRGIMLTPEIRLTGKIDKIEFLGAGVEVNVVDYKTSKPKTRGEIEGSTANSNGDIKRQLVFYNLLLDLFEDGKKFKMVSADVDFIEPDDKGRYHKEAFTVVPEEIQELRTTILTTADAILNLSFWDSRCEDKECAYCHLREMMR